MKEMVKVILLGVMLVSLASAGWTGESKTIFVLNDPRGDDHGDGTLVYPLRDDLHAGDLDLLSLSAHPDASGTEIEAVFARPTAKAGRRTIDQVGTVLSDVARLGFYTMNIDIYIDTDRVAGSGRVDSLPGRKVEIQPDFAWEKVVCLTPRPFEAIDSLKRIWLNQAKLKIKDELGREDPEAVEKAKADIALLVSQRVFCPTRVNVVGSTVRFLVPAAFLGGQAKSEWAYVVAVSGADISNKFDLSAVLGLKADGRASMMILPVKPGTWQDRFGGGREDDNLQPPLADIIVPEGMKQEQLLRDYDLRSSRPVRLPGVTAGAKPGTPASETQK